MIHLTNIFESTVPVRMDGGSAKILVELTMLTIGICNV
jgi:hypothetical protein